MEPKKAVIYARVSTREQADSGYSIESQTKLLKDYARSHDLEVVREFTDVESAKGTGRPQFAEMRKYLAINRSVKTILCEKTDRLYRNFSDYVDLDVDQGDLTVILVKENTILNKESRSHEKLVHGFKVLLAKNYIDNLREETSKGMLEKAEQGEFPDRAPLGYKNNKETHRIDVVPEQAPLIRRMFELYAAGQLSITNCWEKMTEEGLRTRSGRKIARSQIAFMLANPIYHGEFRFRGKLYKGVHQPIISKGLFETVQKVLKRWDKPRKTPREYAFRGFLTCGKCGCSFTAQTKKKKYIYYNCTQARGKCLNAWVREDRLDAKIGEILKQFQMSPGDFEKTKTGLLQSHAGEKDYHDQTIATLHQDYRKLQAKLDCAYNDKLEGKITAEFWEKQAASWRREQEENRAAVGRHESANQSYFQLGVAILELASTAYENYRVRSLSEKRRLASALLSNLTVTGENVVPVYKEPFGLLAEGLSRPNWLPQKYLAGNKFSVEKTIRKCLDVIPDLEKTPLGGRLRFLRRRQRLTQVDLARRTGISAPTICKLERGGATLHPEIVGKLLAYFGREAAEAFPEGKDGVDHFLPVTGFGSWLRNFRVRKGLQQVELAKLLGVCKASVSAYEQNQTRPRDVVLKRLKKVFRLNGEFDRFL